MEEQAPSLRPTKEIISTYLECGLRMLFYAYLDKLGMRSLYCYTVRVIFVHKTDEPPPKECGVGFGGHDIRSKVQRVQFRIC